MFEKVQRSLESEEPDKVDYKLIHKLAVTDLSKPPPFPPIAISIGLDSKEYGGTRYPLRFGTFGNISMIKGEEKARKSFLKSMLLACAIGGNSNNYAEDIKGHNLENKWIFDIDTEQDDYDVYLNASRVPKMVGAAPKNYLSIKLRDRSKSEVQGYLEWLFMESPYKSNLGIVSIDGYVDCIQDFNSQVESDEFTRKLMKWSTLSKAHITGILHLNPGTDKARGHLGTILQQKCETVVVIKDQGDFSSVICQRGRGKRWDTFTIRVDNDWLPYVSDDKPEEIQNNFKI